MKKPKLISLVLSMLGVGMIAVAIVIQNVEYKEEKVKVETKQVDVKNIATLSRKEKVEEKERRENPTVILPTGEEVPAARDENGKVIEPLQPQRIEVYEGLTIEELSAKLDRNLADVMSGKGNLIATTALSRGVDPYVATAIILLETGCGHGRCSGQVIRCNNVGGQKGYPSCDGAYKGYPTLDEGIVGFIDNLYNNYYARGLTTVETIGPRYA